MEKNPKQLGTLEERREPKKVNEAHWTKHFLTVPFLPARSQKPHILRVIYGWANGFAPAADTYQQRVTF